MKKEQLFDKRSVTQIERMFKRKNENSTRKYWKKRNRIRSGKT